MWLLESFIKCGAMMEIYREIKAETDRERESDEMLIFAAVPSSWSSCLTCVMNGVALLRLPSHLHSLSPVQRQRGGEAEGEKNLQHGQ